MRVTQTGMEVKYVLLSHHLESREGTVHVI